VKAGLELSTHAKDSGGVDSARAAAAERPDDPESRLKLAEALAASGSYEEALAIALDLVETHRKTFGDAARQVMVNVFQLLSPFALGGPAAFLGHDNYWETVLSIGLALSFTPLFTASLGSLQPRFYSYGSAVLGTVQQVAGAAGIALMITIMASVTAGAIEGGAGEAAAGAQGAQAAFTIAAIVSLPLVIGAFLIRKPADQQGPVPAAH
jgi:hypothetical protein